MRRGITRVKKTIQRITTDDQIDDYHPRIIPESLASLSENTGFSREELARMYREFKQHCPGGGATYNDLKPAWSKIFPLGDSSKYAQIIFNSFDRDKDGVISFDDIIVGLACIVKGDTDQRLTWIFDLYDTNGDGLITRQEMNALVTSIYEMIQSNDSLIKCAVNEHVERIFRKMDLNGDGVISREEFFESCKNDDVIHDQIRRFDQCMWW